MKRLFLIATLLAGALLILTAQDTLVLPPILKGDRTAIAVPDFRGSGEAQALMAVFNQTLWSDLEGAGSFRMVAKSMYPKTVPQQLSDFTVAPPPPTGRRQSTAPTNGGGRWLSDWSSPPASANYVTVGYTGVSNGVLVLQGWLVDVSKDNPANASALAQRYTGTVNEAGARKIAHEFAADILKLFGVTSLAGTHIYFVSDRTGHKEIWVMDPDGQNQRQITHFNSITIEPSVSADGTKIAFTSYSKGNPGIFVFSVDPARDLRFYNQRASVNSTPTFTPDGTQILYSSSAGFDGCGCRIFIANLDGTGFRPLTARGWKIIDTEPKVNPKTGAEVLFTTGRSGPAQIYRMNIDGGDMERVTDGTGEATNPSWNPNGQLMAYAWTRGYSTGAFNIFIMDLATRRYTQLTHNEGKNENPAWAPDGAHIAFGSTRGGRRSQIYTMLADGTQVHALTTQGENTRPVWGK